MDTTGWRWIESGDPPTDARLVVGEGMEIGRVLFIKPQGRAGTDRERWKVEFIVPNGLGDVRVGTALTYEEAKRMVRRGVGIKTVEDFPVGCHVRVIPELLDVRREMGQGWDHHATGVVASVDEEHGFVRVLFDTGAGMGHYRPDECERGHYKRVWEAE